MRVYTRKEFLKLPPGTLYCSGQDWAFGPMSVKADSLVYDIPGGANDFVCLELNDIEAASDAEISDRSAAMIHRGASFPMASSYGRDGMYEEDEIYLVYEPEDLDRLIEICQAAKAVVVRLRLTAPPDQAIASRKSMTALL